MKDDRGRRRRPPACVRKPHGRQLLDHECPKGQGGDMLSLQITLNVWEDKGVSVSWIDCTTPDATTPGYYTRPGDLAQALEWVNQVIEDHKRERLIFGHEPLRGLESAAGQTKATGELGAKR